MWVKTQTVTLSVLCSAAMVTASAAPALPTTHAAQIRSAEYRYALTAATIDAAFNPIQYLGNVGGAAQAVATDVIYWQTPDFPLLVLSAQVDAGTGQYAAVQKVTSTTAHLQNLVSAVTSIPGASSAPQVRQLVSGIGAVGAAAAGATQTVTATLAPHLAPLTPVIYVVRVLRAAVGVYYAVATLSTTGLGTVLSGQNPLTAVANVVSSVQGLANVLANAPQPSSSSSTGTAATSTAAVPHALTSATAPASAAAPKTATGDVDQPQSRSAAHVPGKRASKTAEPATPADHGTSDAKSTDTQSDTPIADHTSTAKQPSDDAAAPKSTKSTKSKATAADKSTDAADAQPAPSTGTTKKSKHPAKGDDHATHDSTAGQAESAPKAKDDHERRGH